MEPTVAVADDGRIFVLDNGWAASFKNGERTEALLFSADAMVDDFEPVRASEEVYKIVEQAKKALKKR